MNNNSSTFHLNPNQDFKLQQRQINDLQETVKLQKIKIEELKNEKEVTTSKINNLVYQHKNKDLKIE